MVLVLLLFLLLRLSKKSRIKYFYRHIIILGICYVDYYINFFCKKVDSFAVILCWRVSLLAAKVAEEE